MKKLIATLATAFLSSFLFAQSPGGVNTGIRAWYRADNPANTVTSWAQQYSANAATRGFMSSNNGTLNTSGANLLNFNRSYSLANDCYFVLPSGVSLNGNAASSFSIFGVARMAGAGGQRKRIFSTNEFGVDNNSLLMGYFNNTEGSLHIYSNPSYLVAGSNGVTAATTNLNMFSLTRTGGTTATTFRKNGTQISSSATSTTSTSSINLQINGCSKWNRRSCFLFSTLILILIVVFFLQISNSAATGCKVNHSVFS